jgi:hypothetical protein
VTGDAVDDDTLRQLAQAAGLSIDPTTRVARLAEPTTAPPEARADGQEPTAAEEPAGDGEVLLLALHSLAADIEHRLESVERSLGEVTAAVSSILGAVNDLTEKFDAAEANRVPLIRPELADLVRRIRSTPSPRH